MSTAQLSFLPGAGRHPASGPPWSSVLRDAPRGLEVLMLRRADKPGDQNFAAVFPAGCWTRPTLVTTNCATA